MFESGITDFQGFDRELGLSASNYISWHHLGPFLKKSQKVTVCFGNRHPPLIKFHAIDLRLA